MQETLGFSHFLKHLDAIGIGVLMLLIALSVASWYLIAVKAMYSFRQERRARAFLASYEDVRSPGDLAKMARDGQGNNAFANLARTALQAAPTAYGNDRQLSDPGEFLTRALRRAIDEETLRAEQGLTLMASAGSAAPYIGLFGTVWAIYHALVQISISGQGTLDKVAGPVGEALIMTALGLAVAIPAVLAYNQFRRHNRIWLARLDGFAHDLYALLTTHTPSKTSRNDAGIGGTHRATEGKR